MSITTLDAGDYNGFYWELKQCVISGKIFQDFYFTLPDGVDFDILERFNIKPSTRFPNLYFVVNSVNQKELFSIFDKILYEMLI